MNDGAPTGSVGSSTGKIADLNSLTGYGIVNTNISRSTWKWDGRWGTYLKTVASPAQFISINASTAEASNTWSISAWVKMASFLNFGHILVHGISSDRNRDMYIDQTTGKLTVNFTSPASSFRFVQSVAGIQLNTWAHVVGTFDGTTLKAYVNGRLNNSSVNAFVPTTGAAQPTLLGNSNFGSSEGINGSFLHVAEWTRAITAEEVGQLYLFPAVLLPRYGGAAINPAPPSNPNQFIYPTIYGGLSQPDNQHGGPLPFGQLSNLDTLTHG